MNRLPFVLGTDIIRISRLDPIQRPTVFIKLAKRILRPDETPGTRSKPTFLRDSGSRIELHEWLTAIQQPPPFSPSTEATEAKAFANEAQLAARWLAGRWAAKEAAMKAWGAGLVSLKDMKVTVDLDAPYVEGSTRPVMVECRPSYDDVSRYLGRDWNTAADGRERFRQHGTLSISHDGDYCIATVIAEPLKEELMTIFRQRTDSVRGRQANGWRSVENESTEVDDGPDARESLPVRRIQASERKSVKNEDYESVDSSASRAPPSKLPHGRKPVTKEDRDDDKLGNNRPWYEGRV